MYACPMHPDEKFGRPGICRLCGMALVPSKEKGAVAERHTGHDVNVFRKKFWIALALTIPVVAYSFLPGLPGGHYLPALLGSAVFFYGSWVFLASAIRELRGRQPGMMTLISLAIITAYAYSVYSFFTGGETLFWELSTLITVMLLGHWMEMAAVGGAQGALRELSKLLPDTAELIGSSSTGSPIKIVPISELKAGDLVLVRPGGKIPADGVVVDGQSDVNESMATGESKPVGKSEKSPVIAGTINGDGVLKIKVTGVGEHTFLAGVMRLVAEAQASKSKLQLLADRAAFYLTIIAILSGSATVIYWAATGAGPAFAIERAVAVLVIACPHALGLAIPLVAVISTAKAASSGVLVRQRLALEAARKIDLVLFDKTGTLTTGSYGVLGVSAVDGIQDEVVKMAAAVDANSEHPVAKAIVAEAKKRKLGIPQAKDFSRVPGQGSRGVIGDKKVFVGNEGQMKVPADFVGKTVVYVSVDGKTIGAIALGDLVREESKEAIADLKKMKVGVAMITGDSEEVAARVAEELGIKEYFARVLPEQKSEKVKILQERGLSVAIVGDGINDAPALARADVGIAIGAGTNVAIESAGVVLVKNDPRDVVKIIRLGRATYGKMAQNLFWATGYNIIALPLAAGVLASRGFVLNPAVSAFLMSASTVIVAINALLLKYKKI